MRFDGKLTAATNAGRRIKRAMGEPLVWEAAEVAMLVASGQASYRMGATLLTGAPSRLPVWSAAL